MTNTLGAVNTDQQRIILERRIAAPLRQLRLTAGNPSYEKLAESAGLSRNSVDNALNARRQVSWPTLEAIVTALGGDRVEWQKRWADAAAEIQRLRQPAPVQGELGDGPPTAAQTEPADTQKAPGDQQVAGRPDRRSARRPVLLGISGLLILGLSGAEAGSVPSGDERSPSYLDVAATAVPGEPVYEQCSDLPRSILTAPGRSRGGRPAGQLHPGERFVIEGRTEHWRCGHVQKDPQRMGWVLAVYLCAVISD